MSSLQEHWLNEECPIFNGILYPDGLAESIRSPHLPRREENVTITEWIRADRIEIVDFSNPFISIELHETEIVAMNNNHEAWRLRLDDPMPIRVVTSNWPHDPAPPM